MIDLPDTKTLRAALNQPINEELKTCWKTAWQTRCGLRSGHTVGSGKIIKQGNYLIHYLATDIFKIYIGTVGAMLVESRTIVARFVIDRSIKTASSISQRHFSSELVMPTTREP